MHSSIATQDIAEVANPNRVSRYADRPLVHLILILLVWAVLYVPGMFSPALLDDADSVHAEAAKEMVQQGQWHTLYINNGFRYLEKAPLMYWGMAASYKLLGVSEWSARLPLTLGMLALLLAVYSLGRRAFDARAGLYSAIILATSFGPYIFTRILIPEALVCLWLTLGFHFFLQGLEEERPSRRTCWGLAVTVALGVLTKGLIGLVFPGGIILLYLLITGNLKHLLRMRLVSSFVVFLVIAAPWHIVAGLANPAAGESKGFFWFYFINEHVLRYLNKRFPKDYDTVPFGLFWGMMILWLIPWSAFVFKGLGQMTVRLRALRSLDRRGRALLLCAIWAALILLFFSFSSRQEYYTIPALPGLALIVGAWLSKEQSSAAGSRERIAGRRVALVMMVVAIPAFVIAMMLLKMSEAVPPGMDIADILTKNPEKYALSFGHFFDLNPQAMGIFRAPLAISTTALLLGTVFAWWLRRKGKAGWSNVALTVMMVVFLHCAHRGLEIFEPVLSSKAFLPAIQKYYQPGEVIVINGAYEDASTLNFYGGYQLHVLNTRTNGNLYYGSLFPDAPNVFEDNGSFERLWNGQKRVFVWTEEDKIPFLLTYTQAFLVARGGGKLILTNHRLLDKPDTLWVPPDLPKKQARR